VSNGWHPSEPTPATPTETEALAAQGNELTGHQGHSLKQLGRKTAQLPAQEQANGQPGKPAGLAGDTRSFGSLRNSERIKDLEAIDHYPLN